MAHLVTMRFYYVIIMRPLLLHRQDLNLQSPRQRRLYPIVLLNLGVPYIPY